MRKKRWISGILIIMIILTGWPAMPNAVHACSCALSGSVMEERSRNDAVFEGTVKTVKQPFSLFGQSSAAPVKTLFQVNEVWKGHVTSEIEVSSAMSSASCGVEFQVGDRYLVYARNTGSSLDVSMCSRTVLYSAAGSDISELGNGSIPPQFNAGSADSSGQLWWLIGSFISLLVIAATVFVIMKKRSSFKSKI